MKKVYIAALLLSSTVGLVASENSSKAGKSSFKAQVSKVLNRKDVQLTAGALALWMLARKCYRVDIDNPQHVTNVLKNIGNRIKYRNIKTRWTLGGASVSVGLVAAELASDVKRNESLSGK